MATAVVVAAGTGERLKADRPKALIELVGRPLVAWCLAAFEASESVRAAVIAAPPGQERAFEEIAAQTAPSFEVGVTAGGASRSQSVVNALALVGDDIIVVHDAARPLVRAELIDRCVAELEGRDCDGVVAAARATDTVKETDAGGRVTATLERTSLWAVQTPQVFRAEMLRRALDDAPLERATDDAQLVEAIGGDVRIVEASRDNFKVTSSVDLKLAELLLAERI